jgi:hypothetical protein
VLRPSWLRECEFACMGNVELSVKGDAEVRTMYDISVESIKGMIPRYSSVKEEKRKSNRMATRS